jgi:uncharacterized membrane protein YccC
METGLGGLVALALSLGLLALKRAGSRNAYAYVAVGAARTHALWMAVATFATAGIVIAAGVPHWQWAPIATAAVLQGTDATTVFSRAVQRSAGTVVGVLITAVLLLTEPAFLATVLVCGACIGASQLLFPRNYALGIMCITPLAFLLPGITNAMGDTSSLLQRVWATALGAALGVAAWYVASRRSHRD